MAKDPAVLFYTSDFLTGTMLMTDEEIGQYIKLLCLQHQRGRLTKNHMVSICKSLDSEVVNKFTVDSNGLYYNERMEEESIKRKNFTESRKHNGSKGGRPKTEKPSAKPNGKPKHNLTEDENENEDINEVFNFKKSLLDLDIEKEIVSDWLKVRSKKKAVNSETAFKSIKTQIEKSELSANDCIRIAVEKSWAGFESDWITDKSHSSGGYNDINSQTVKITKPKPIPKDLYDN